MTEHGADWYDKVLVADDSPAMLPLEESPWLPVYEKIADMIAPNEEVVDLGCGTGRFIALLRRNGHSGQITGVDWSAAALTEAAHYNRFGDCKPEFHCEDLDQWEADPVRAGNTVYVCTEVLEHLDRDRDLVERVPPGHRLLLSLPNFPSESHARWFTHVGAIWQRYDSLLQFRSWALVGAELKAIHVLETIRRTDSW